MVYRRKCCAKLCCGGTQLGQGVEAFVNEAPNVLLPLQVSTYYFYILVECGVCCTWLLLAAELMMLLTHNAIMYMLFFVAF